MLLDIGYSYWFVQWISNLYIDIVYWTYTQIRTANIKVAFLILDIEYSNGLVQWMSLLVQQYWILNTHIELYSEISMLPFWCWTLNIQMFFFKCSECPPCTLLLDIGHRVWFVPCWKYYSLYKPMWMSNVRYRTNFEHKGLELREVGHLNVKIEVSFLLFWLLTCICIPRCCLCKGQGIQFPHRKKSNSTVSK